MAATEFAGAVVLAGTPSGAVTGWIPAVAVNTGTPPLGSRAAN